MLCSSLTMAFASFAHFLSCCQKPHADSGHGRGNKNGGRATNKGRPWPLCGRPSSRTWPVRRREQGGGFSEHGLHGGASTSSRGDASCALLPGEDALTAPGPAPGASPGARRRGAGSQPCFWTRAVTRPPPAPGVVEPGPGQLRAAGSGHPRPAVGSRKEFHPAQRPPVVGSARLPESMADGISGSYIRFWAEQRFPNDFSVVFSCSK